MSEVIVRNPATRRNIVNYMITYYMENNRQPSVREIGHAVGITSTSTMAGYLTRMVNEGSLARNDDNARRIYSVTEYGRETYGLARA